MASRRAKNNSLARTTKASLLDNEVMRYLSTTTIDVEDPIKWWCANKAEYPHLWRMAADYLSVPGESSSELLH